MVEICRVFSANNRRRVFFDGPGQPLTLDTTRVRSRCYALVFIQSLFLLGQSLRQSLYVPLHFVVLLSQSPVVPIECLVVPIDRLVNVRIVSCDRRLKCTETRTNSVLILDYSLNIWSDRPTTLPVDRRGTFKDTTWQNTETNVCVFVRTRRLHAVWLLCATYIYMYTDSVHMHTVDTTCCPVTMPAWPEYYKHARPPSGTGRLVSLRPPIPSAFLLRVAASLIGG